MNKLLTKTVKKVTLISIVLAVIVVVSAVLTAIFGVNFGAELKDSKTLTVSVNSFYYETQSERIEQICEAEFDKNDVKAEYKQHGFMSGDECEIMFVFDKDTDLTATKTALETTFGAADWEAAFISVEVATETVQTKIPAYYVVRGVLAIVLFAALAFAYTCLRYKLNKAIVTASSALVGGLVTAMFLLLVRIPVTTSMITAVAVSALLSTVFTLFTLNKLRASELTASEDVTAEDLIVANVAVKETVVLTVVLGVALVLVGAIATAAVRWFAVCALIGLLFAAAVALFFAPALYLPLKEYVDKKERSRAKYGYVGAKKSEENDKE